MIIPSDIIDNKIPYVLVVDDILKNLQVIGTILEEAGFEISVADNGKDAIEMVKADKPDLILLDIMMPEMSGFEVIRHLKANPETEEIPVIFLTAKTETEDIVQGFNLGGVDYITKPFKKEELLSRIRTHTELKLSKDLIMEQNEKLIKLNKDKNEFIGITAHDLKNPLGAILGLSEVIVRGDFELSMDEIKDFSKDIYKSAQNMFSLVTDLLDINAIEEGKMKMDFTDFDMCSELNTAMKRFVMRAEEKSIELIIDVPEEEIPVFADLNKINQILDNLISNAIKFSPIEKKIWIRASIITERHYVKVEVQDQGPGITEEDRKKLFQKFAKLSARPTGSENSTGLGLSIVKKLIEDMFGKIWVESEPGEGSNFIFTLPLAGKPS